MKENDIVDFLQNKNSKFLKNLLFGRMKQRFNIKFWFFFF